MKIRPVAAEISMWKDGRTDWKKLRVTCRIIWYETKMCYYMEM